MRKFASIIACCFLWVSPSLAQTEVHGEYQTSLAVEFEGGDVQKFDHILKLEFSSDVTDDVRLFGLGRVRYNMINRLDYGAPGDEAHRQRLDRQFLVGDGELELRELYIDGYAGDMFYRLGKQQIVWGQADGLRVLDVLNPFDFREFILPEFDDYRIPLWTTNIELPLADGTAQLVWIPDQTYDQTPVFGSGAAFEFSSPLFVPQVPSSSSVTIDRTSRPSRFFADSDVGVRYTTFKGGWDLSVNYLYHFQDTQILRRTVDDNGAVAITPGYERTHLIGGSFSNAFGAYTLRGEVGYSTNRYFITTDPSDSDGVVETPELSSVIGIDYQGIRDVFLSGQIFTNYITSFQEGLTRPKNETKLTLLYEHKFMNDLLTTKLQLIHSVNDSDGLIRAGAAYDFRSNVVLKAGLDFFYGSKNGLFGQFQNNDRATIGIEIGF